MRSNLAIQATFAILVKVQLQGRLYVWAVCCEVQRSSPGGLFKTEIRKFAFIVQRLTNSELHCADSNSERQASEFLHPWNVQMDGIHKKLTRLKTKPTSGVSIAAARAPSLNYKYTEKLLVRSRIFASSLVNNLV